MDMSNDRARKLPLPDLLIPQRLPQARLALVLREAVGSDATPKLVELADLAVRASAHGDFAAQVAIGDAIARIGEEVDHSELRATGHYFSGEGHRLLIGPQDGQAESRYQIAITEYK